MNVNDIEIAISQKIDSSTTDFELLAASKALQLLRTNGVFVASTFNSLPSAATNEGKIYFIEDTETTVWSNGTFWITLGPVVTQLFAWGDNKDGKLGDGTNTERCSPVREFCSATDWCMVSAGECHTVAIKTSGQIWSWGKNGLGNLGTGTISSSCSPVRELCSAADWCTVSVGEDQTLAIKTSGQLWAWGSNTCGRLGEGTTVNRCSPVQEFCSAVDWCSVSTGGRISTAIKTSGQLWAWGGSSDMPVGDGTTINRCSPVREFCSATDWCQSSAGSIHAAAIKTSGQLWAWGFNCCGRVGDGTQTARCSPVREFCSALDWCCVTAGSAQTAALKTSGQIWSWGNNACGRLGDGTTVTRLSPVREFCSATDWRGLSTATFHTAGVKTSGELWSWGRNYAGQLGDGTLTTRCSPVREFCSATTWCQVSAGGIQTFAIKIA